MESATVRTKALNNAPSLLKNAEKTKKNVKATGVVNSLNRINFQGDHVFVKLRHIWRNSFITATAKPAPGDGEGVQLLWDESEKTVIRNISSYEYFGFFYTDGLKMVWVKAGLLSMNSENITLAAPTGGDEVSERNHRRFKCLEISVELAQGTTCLQGTMKDYNAPAFAIAISKDQVDAVQKINIDMPVDIILTKSEEILFKAPCRIIRASSAAPETTIVLAPVSNNIKKFIPKKSRSIRQKLLPQPCIEFNHPFLGKKISLKTVDVSGAGVSVAEDPANSLLMPGMVIPEMTIIFANNFKIHCKSQVLHNRYVESGDLVQAGLVFLDMNCEDQIQLASILYQTKNDKSYVGTDIDQNELWDFFFETGFVYPKKYKSIEAQKSKFKSLYNTLYKGCPDIARHIIYRDKGVIYGHLSIFRYYQKTWLFHHHAAIKSSQHKAGLVVLDHLLQHVNDVHNLSDAAMKYIACYFRPNNRFANRVFGGGLRSLQDPKKGSLDEFAYFHHNDNKAHGLPRDWVLTRSNREDFERLKSCYDEVSGGLMLVGLDLDKEVRNEEDINSRYKQRGLKRERKFYTLKNAHGRAAAMFVLNFSDVGLNMSSLTDCIQVMVIDHKNTGPDKIIGALDILGDNFEGETPVLLFPKSYADDNELAYENVYTLGVLNLNFISKFLSFLADLTKPRLRLAKK